MHPVTPLFDGHNDTLLRLVRTEADPMAAFQNCRGRGHLDMSLARIGHFAGGLFACFVPPEGDRDAGFALTPDGYTVAMPEPPSLAHATQLTDRMIACAHRLQAAGPASLQICRTVPEIRESMAARRIAMVLHLEGAEAIGDDLAALQHYHSQGVRSIGPVWSRTNRFGTGVPFRYPGNPDLGPGLTESGFALVHACNELGIMLDISHLNAAGFWDLADTSTAPLVATHSNAHAICPVPRNLTDPQLDAIRMSKGLVAISLSVSELRPDGHNDPATPLAIVLRHIDHLLRHLGDDGVAIGSDMDGAVLPADISDASGLQSLVAAMQRHGYGPALIQKICSENWLGVLARTWGP